MRIQRYVPYFSTSRDAARYERLKAGLALYRLVFGQMNQEDLLTRLQDQLETRSPEEKERTYRRLASYMLNLSPLTHGKALERATEEAQSILLSPLSTELASRLLSAIQVLRGEHGLELSTVSRELDDLIAVVQRFAEGAVVPPGSLDSALKALCYLRNPYDRIFDLHGEAGLSDDVEVIREEWRRLYET